MEYDEVWGTKAPMYWLQALSLPILPWAKPFVPLLGLPDGLLQHLDVWEPIYQAAVLEEETRKREENWPVERRNELTRQIVTKALKQLADKVGRDAAIDFEYWVIRNFFAHDIELALEDWQCILKLAYNQPNNKDHIPPPSVLTPILPEIAELVSSDRSLDLMIETNKAAPPSPYPTFSSDKREKCYEAMMLYKAAKKALIIKALQIIASRLNEQECKEVLVWARLQAEAIRQRITTDLDKLCGDQYLRVEPPTVNFPSVLDFPFSGEE